MGTAVERNTEYVLDYKRLIDPVSYTVSFIDSQTKEQIATPQIIYGNAEETIMVTPVTVSDYTPTESSKTLKLEKGKANTATFEYRYTGAVETITSTVTNVVPGTTRTETVVSEVEETVIVPGAAQPLRRGARRADAGRSRRRGAAHDRSRAFGHGRHRGGISYFSY